MFFDQPALKLLDFFRTIARSWGTTGAQADPEARPDVVHETSELQRSSATMRKLEPMSEEHARMWVRYWRSRKFIS